MQIADFITALNPSTSSGRAAANIESTWRRKYEEAFARFADAHGARAFGLGRHALAILLKALDIQPGDKVGVCAFTCLAVVEAVRVCNAIPVYLDIDEHLCIDPQEILIQDYGTLKVVILQHTFGNPGRLDQLLAACEKIGAKTIEDCAHAPDCTWNNKKLGTFGEGAVGQGGMLTVNSSRLLAEVDRQIKRFAAPVSKRTELITACRKWLYHPFSQSRLDCYLGYQYSRLRSMLRARGTSFLKDGFPVLAGYPRQAGEMKAKEKLKQLEEWPKLKQTRLQNTAMIEEYFSNAGLSLWPKPPQANITLMRYPLRVYKKWEIVHKGGIRGLDIAGWYSSPVHPLGGKDLAKVDYKEGSCPRAEGTIERLIHLPTDESLNERKMKAMIRIITDL
ncbi:MAG: DegT/DnrJ/EryC1/StrS aminotransferase family protein [Sedimentisphaerales bacterium]|nr:DegT/DnrJ/EryC1/StrS aminotransferase family protein [Sedimentisphaerales bacterium]